MIGSGDIINKGAGEGHVPLLVLGGRDGGSLSVGVEEEEGWYHTIIVLSC